MEEGLLLILSMKPPSTKLQLWFVLFCSIFSITQADLPRSTPEAQGISASALQAFVEAADSQVDTMNSLMVLRHGQVVAEGWWTPYDADTPHVLYSLTKSFTSTAVGLAAAEGKLSIDDSLLSFFPDQAPTAPSANLRAMRLRDLLRMSTGQHAEDVEKFAPGPQENWTKAFFAIPVAHKPGTHFFYNSPGSYMLSASVQKATGQTAHDFLMSRLFEPLGIANPLWKESPQGVSIGSYGLNLRTEDIARFGQLYLQKGKWEGRQLVPADWVEQATSLQTANGSDPQSEWEQGYGFQFWRCRYGFYRGDGAFGQFCIVMPQYDAVVVITSGSRDMQSVMNLVWDHIVPALKPSALPENQKADELLNQRLKGLSIHLVKSRSSITPNPEFINKHFSLPTNNQIIEKVMLSVGESGQTQLSQSRWSRRTNCLRRRPMDQGQS